MADRLNGSGDGHFAGVMQRRAANVGGRPKGSRNKRSLDLARYVEAQFGGMTPGQQAAALSMVTPGELRNAKADAAALGVVDLGLSPLTLAMAVKARRLARAIHCEVKEAWLLLAKEREGLMAYVHQKQPQAADRSGAPRPVAFMVPEGQEGETPMLSLFDDEALDNPTQILDGSAQVTDAKSRDGDN
jgi:hypothetical protein